MRISSSSTRSRSAGTIVVIDTFRAATTACQVLHQGPSEYLVVADSMVAARLAADRPGAVLVGKPEIGATLHYDVPNSPTRVAALQLAGRPVIHRTTAGTTGVLTACARSVLLAGLVNATATAALLHSQVYTLTPMGHEGNAPSLEDDLTADCIRARVEGLAFDLTPHVAVLRRGAGRYFFGEDQAQYPAADFDRCLTVDLFDFAVRADLVDDYARLSRA